jgi:hypothetical protein
MPYTKATTIVKKTLGTKQDPDRINYTKQWDGVGQLKGWMVELRWGEHMVWLDITMHCTRVVGDLNRVPDYIAGKHQSV